MMRITIAQRLRPFSHQPGVLCVIPGSFYQLQVFPTLIRLYETSQTQPKFLAEFNLNLPGPVRNFTVLQDLEKGHVSVWGETPIGYVRYHVVSGNDGHGIKLIVEKAPSIGLKIKNSYTNLTLHNKEETFLVGKAPWTPFKPEAIERLDLGSHKALDWELVQRRQDLKDILPAWYRLGQLVPNVQPVDGEREGLLNSFRQTIKEQQPDQIGSFFLHLFQAGFEGLLSPRLFDQQYQGFEPILTNASNTSPLVLLKEGSQLIRSLFIQPEKNKIFILPALPTELHCGRLIQARVDEGLIDLEWSKKRIRRLIFYNYKDQNLSFQFKHVKNFRLRSQDNERGQVIANHSTLPFKKNYHYFFDNFT